jgi:chemotaxis protein CheD
VSDRKPVQPMPPDLPDSGVRTLLPGDVAVGARGMRLETLLGSCVAIVLTDPRRTVDVCAASSTAASPPRVDDRARHA